MGSPFTTAATVERPATDAAKNYLRDLMLDKAVAAGHDASQASVNITAWIAAHADKATISANIDRLKAEGFTGRQSRGGVNDVPRNDLPSAEVVPAGRYAVETEDGATNGLAFYKVDRPTEGRWAGKVFVKLMVSDEEQRMSWSATRSILAKIAEVGAAEASARYGHEIGECGICGRTLTNDESRERGIGPICAAKNGW